MNRTGVEITQLRQAIKDCRACDLRNTALQPVPWKGELDPDILIIGEAPGSQEDKVGEPFVGSAGGMLNGKLRESGLYKVATLAYANSCQCYPQRGLSATADSYYIDTCRKWMLAQVEMVNPQYIITVGTVAYRSVWGHRTWPTLGQMHGKPMWWQTKLGEEGGHIVWPTYHPSAALRSGKYKRLLLEDLTNFKTFVDNGEVWNEDMCAIGDCADEMVGWDAQGRGIPLCERHSMRQGELL